MYTNNMPLAEKGHFFTFEPPPACNFFIPLVDKDKFSFFKPGNCQSGRAAAGIQPITCSRVMPTKAAVDGFAILADDLTTASARLFRY